ncbi:hypothetical protein [Helicobacter suis]|uniref:hypothetical protein n=1 Tax=Helicobacter suis TaxID=104628 RepID=UPI0013D6A26F|nr:hypothetical protein [Helicobacter suis]
MKFRDVYRDYEPDVSAAHIPLEIFSAGLSCKALGVLTYLHSFYATPSLNKLAERLEESPEAILKCLEELRAREFIRLDLATYAKYPDQGQTLILTLPEERGA